MARGYLLPNHPQIIPDHPIRLLPKESDRWSSAASQIGRRELGYCKTLGTTSCLPWKIEEAHDNKSPKWFLIDPSWENAFRLGKHHVFLVKSTRLLVKAAASGSISIWNLKFWSRVREITIFNSYVSKKSPCNHHLLFEGVLSSGGTPKSSSRHGWPCSINH